MERVGKVDNLSKQFSFEWKIDNFFSLSIEDGKSYCSPLFEFANESWYLTVYPNGDPDDDSVGNIEVYLYRDFPSLPTINLSCSFGLKTFDGKKVHEQHYTFVFGEDDTTGYGSYQLLTRFTLLERKSELVPCNILTIIFTVDYFNYFSKSSNDAVALAATVNDRNATRMVGVQLRYDLFNSSVSYSTHMMMIEAKEQSQLISSRVAACWLLTPVLARWNAPGRLLGNTVTVKCSHCKKVFIAECLSSHEQKCLDKPIRCPTCSDVVSLREWFDHECQTARVKASEKVIDDLAHIFDSEKYSDVIIKVKDREFRLHRSILAGRNAYFSSMFNTDMKEKTTGMVSIDDCEPNIFSSFIHFVYTGKLQPLSYDNVCALYKVADKYQEDFYVYALMFMLYEEQDVHR